MRCCFSSFRFVLFHLYIIARDSSATKADIIVHTITKKKTKKSERQNGWKMNIEHLKREEYFVICYRFRLAVSSVVCHRSSSFSVAVFLAGFLRLFNAIVQLFIFHFGIKNPCPICSHKLNIEIDKTIFSIAHSRALKGILKITDTSSKTITPIIVCFFSIYLLTLRVFR